MSFYTIVKESVTFGNTKAIFSCITNFLTAQLGGTAKYNRIQRILNTQI